VIGVAASMRSLLTALLLLAALLLLGLGATTVDAQAEIYFDARVVGVVDGDTIDVLVGEEQRRIRLAGIDTPERGQPWATQARQALAERVFGKDVRINQVTVDRFGRTVGEVYAADVCVGCELVRDGHAWVYRRYSNDPVLLELEAEAQREKRGLWGLPEAQRIAPWDWRTTKGRKPRVAPADPADFACGEKQRCGEMTSCAEARFHHRECGLTRLDGDGDGVPCEALCQPR